MTATPRSATPQYQEYVVTRPDGVTRFLRWAIFFVILTIVCVLVYALLAGVFSPPAPRTLLESTLNRSQAAVTQDSGDGSAWASLAGAQYANGEKEAAWATIAKARKKVQDRTILQVNNRELDFLIIEGKNAEAIKRADEFIETEANYQMEEKVGNAAKGISVPDQVTNNQDSVRLFVLKGTAQGNLGKWKDAVKTFDQALLLTDTAADIITLRGWARLRAGNAKGAKKDFARALRYMPGDPSATQGLAAASAEVSKTAK